MTADNVIVYELKLEQDGSPSKEKKVSEHVQES
jgi:hypothetical protein